MVLERVVKMGESVGLHGRPGVLLVDLCRKFPSTDIVIRKGEKEAKATSLLNLLALGVLRGDEVTVKINGNDEDIIFDSVKGILSGDTR